MPDFEFCSLYFSLSFGDILSPMVIDMQQVGVHNDHRHAAWAPAMSM